MRSWQDIICYSAALVTAAAVFGFFLFANHTTRAAVNLPGKADAIVALTGGAQRIRAAGDLLEAKLAKRLLISGVNRVVKRAKLQGLLGIDDALFECCVDVDYAAQNTRGNAMETRKWTDKHRFERLIVVTSSYHMPRSLTELGRALPAIDLVAYPVVPERFTRMTWWLDRQSILLLGAEYLKYLPSAAHFRIGRLLDTPAPAKSDQPIVQRAVVVQ